MITIVGSGLGCLMFARVLHMSGIAVTVYDADISATSRHQGRMLNINAETGQSLALCFNDTAPQDLYEFFQSFAGPQTTEGQDHV